MMERSIFLAALDIADPGQRAAYLDQACGNNAELRQHIEELIAAEAKLGSFLARPHANVEATADLVPQVAEQPGSQIGPYKLLQQIGEGGMGVVYMAEQTRPVHRRVALKIVKPGLDSRQVIARFEAERQALAMMDHLNIAKVLDAGATGSGRPYFVMELVHGIPITKYCDDNHLPPRQRLDLFIPVCQAIQHAHQKGIIHRDIKPSNVLVCLYDGKPVPKVIDFGVAKAIEQRLTERTLFTQFGNIIGTFEYMSPEQAEMSQLGVDTRSDVYSLGVLLYELLTGTTPLDRQRLRSVALDEMLRMIREEEPPKPSTRISQSGSLASVAASRNMEPAKLSRLVRGDLDWIVMKCLEKDRTRRYETANGLARDVSRYLSEEPVEACPPSAGYRLKKLVRRNKGPVAAAALVLLTLVGGIAGTTFGLLRAEIARRAEAKQRVEAVDARQKAEAARGVAENERLRALDAERRAQRAADENEKLSNTREQARQETASKLFDALIRESRALKLARQAGYRSKVWDNLKQAVALDFPGKNLTDVREVAVETLADPIGLDPVVNPTYRKSESPELTETFAAVRDSSGAKFHVMDRERQWLATASRSRGQIALWNAAGDQVATCSPQSVVTHLCFAADKLLVTTHVGMTVYAIPDLAVRNNFRTNSLLSIAASPDGRTFAILDRSKRVEVLIAETIRPLAVLAAPNGTTAVDFSPDGTMLFAVSREGQALVGWHVSATPEKRHLAGRAKACKISFSPDGSRIAASADPSDTTVDVWNAITGEPVVTYSGHTEKTTAVTFLPDGRLIASGDVRGNIHLWECETGRGVGRIQVPNRTTPGGLAFRSTRPYVWKLGVACQGKALVSGGESGVHAWTLEPRGSEIELKQFLALPLHDVRNLAIHPSSDTLVFSTYGGQMFSYDLRNAAGPRALGIASLDMFETGDPEQIYAMESLHFDRLGKHLIFATEDRKAGVWDWDTRELIGTSRETFLPLAFAVQDEGRFLAGTRPASRAVVADLQSGEELLRLPEETSSIFSLNWSPDGRQLALGQSDGVAIWDLSEVRRQLASLGLDFQQASPNEPAKPVRNQLSSDAFAQIVKKNQQIQSDERLKYATWTTLLHREEFESSDEFRRVTDALLAEDTVHEDQWESVIKMLRDGLLRFNNLPASPISRDLDSLQWLYTEWGMNDKRIQLLEVKLDFEIAKLGTGHTSTMRTLKYLSHAYQIAKRWPEAIELMERARDASLARFGPDDENTLRQMSNLGSSYIQGRRLAEAIQVSEEVLQRHHAKSLTLTSLAAIRNLAEAYQYAGRYAESIPFYEKLRDGELEMFGKDQALSTSERLAYVYSLANRHSDAIQLYEQVRDARSADKAADSAVLLRTLNGLAMALQAAGKVSEAIDQWKELLPRTRRLLGPTHASTIYYTFALTEALQTAGDFQTAVATLRELLNAERDAFPKDDTRLATALAATVSALLKSHDYLEAESCARECLTIFEKNSVDDWTTFNAKSLLGGALLGQTKHAEAEPLLLTGYQGLKRHETVIPVVRKLRLTEAVQRLVDLYTAWGRPDEAEKWQKTLDERQEEKPVIDPTKQP